MEKVCNKCRVSKSLNDFSNSGGNTRPRCRVCVNEKQRELRKKSLNKDTKKYEKSLKGYLVRTYRNMLSRVRGILKKKSHLYQGLEILDKQDFYKWSLESNYPTLLKQYKDSNYDMKLAPSIDRKDPEYGYVFGNIRWVTHSENSRNIRRNWL